MSVYENPDNTVLMGLETGEVVIELLPKVSPKHCQQFKTLIREEAYDNVCFHRVIAGFMAQTGDVEHANMKKNFNLGRAGTGGSHLPDLPAEFSRLPHRRGSVGAARSMNPNSANSQFFINFKENDFLNGQYTIFAQVVSGMELIDGLEVGEPPLEPSQILNLKIAADI